MNELTAEDVLYIIGNVTQSCRENGKSDMRNILNVVRCLRHDVQSGKTRDEILSEFDNSEEDDE